MKSLLYLVVCVVSLALAGCGGSNKPKETKEYDIKGTVTGIDAKKPAVTLDHEDVPGLMNAMTMEFGVESSTVLEGLKKGDKVKGRVRRGEFGYIISRLEKQ